MSRPANVTALRQVHALADGAEVHLDDTSMTLRDHEGRVLVRYREGVLHLESTGDLVLAAPAGKVVVSGREVEVSSETTVSITGEALDLTARRTRWVSGVVETVARRVSHAAEHVVHRVDRWEVEATRVVERARDSLRVAEELAETRAGRWRARVDDLFTVQSGRTVLDSEEDTTVDGKRVLLG